MVYLSLRLSFWFGLFFMFCDPGYCAEPTDCSPERIVTSRGVVETGNYSIQVLEPDSSDPPTVWEGPILIRDRQGNQCSTSVDLSLISPPLYRNPMGLIVSTYSGSGRTVSIISLSDCKPLWESPGFIGRFTVLRDAFVLGERRWQFGPGCNLNRKLNNF